VSWPVPIPDAQTAVTLIGSPHAQLRSFVSTTLHGQTGPGDGEGCGTWTLCVEHDEETSTRSQLLAVPSTRMPAGIGAPIPVTAVMVTGTSDPPPPSASSRREPGHRFVAPQQRFRA
jgi:hypothetical protein